MRVLAHRTPLLCALGADASTASARIHCTRVVF
jgi:hypothetical protein